MSDSATVTLSTAAFAYLSELCRQEIGMVYAPNKHYLMEARLITLARQAGYDDLDEFVELIRTDPAQRAAVLAELTINETSWFRDSTPFQLLRTHLLPELIAARNHDRTLRIWSAACSSGQEPYSIAMVADQVLPAGWQVELLASDVSAEMVERTAAGIYTQVELNRGLTAQLREQYFTEVDGGWQIIPRIREQVQPQVINLNQPFPALPRFDIVFLRNVLIYFDAATKTAVLQRLQQATTPDAYLFLGSSETLLGLQTVWTPHQWGSAYVYRPFPVGSPPAHTPVSAARST